MTTAFLKRLVTEKVARLTRVRLRIRFLMKGDILSGFCVSGILELRYVLDLPSQDNVRSELYASDRVAKAPVSCPLIQQASI